MRTTADDFVTRQRELNLQLDPKCQQLTHEIEARLSALRRELGHEFTSNEKKVGHTREMMSKLEAQKATMADNAVSHLRFKA